VGTDAKSVTPPRSQPPRRPARVPTIGARPKPAPDVKPDNRYETKCNSMGQRCRRIQTQEFRDWQALQKYKDGIPAAPEG